MSKSAQEILSQPLESFAVTITNAEVRETAEIAQAVRELVSLENIDKIHPARNNDIRCRDSEVDFFPDIPTAGQWFEYETDDDGNVIFDENGRRIVKAERWYVDMDGETTIYDEDQSETEWFADASDEAFLKVLAAKRECMACEAQKQCLIWSLLSDAKVVEDQKRNSKVAAADRIDVTDGVFGGRSAAARTKILSRMDAIERNNIYPSDEALQSARIIIESAANGIDAERAFDLIEQYVA